MNKASQFNQEFQVIFFFHFPFVLVNSREETKAFKELAMKSKAVEGIISWLHTNASDFASLLWEQDFVTCILFYHLAL